MSSSVDICVEEKSRTEDLWLIVVSREANATALPSNNMSRQVNIILKNRKNITKLPSITYVRQLILNILFLNGKMQKICVHFWKEELTWIKKLTDEEQDLNLQLDCN